MTVPESIQKIVDKEEYTTENIGMSGAGVRIYRDKVLKISRDDENARREAGIMDWLRGRLPVPEVIACERRDGLQFLLMTRLPGVMLCDRAVLSDPVAAARLLARAIEAVRAVDASQCPYRADLDTELAIAREHVERGEVDVENTDPATFGPGGFKSPAHLLDWLVRNRPEETAAFTHGDMCLPNIFVKDGAVSGFIDLGGAGIGDPYRDISLARRSLRDNLDGHHGHILPGFDPDILFTNLGVTPDRDKLRYYLLLDELF